MTTKERSDVLQLVRLAPEPWGSKLSRARTLAGFSSLTAVAEKVPDLSKSTLGRLEKRTTPPTSAKGRRQVAMLCVLYGTDLSDLEVSMADLPPYLDLQSLFDLGKLSSGWLTRTAVAA